MRSDWQMMLFFIICIFVSNHLSKKIAKEEIINELCVKQKYDFCIEKTEERKYVLKDGFLNGNN